jgi:hypothetical protein
MRTTLTLDPDVVRLIEDEVHRHRKPFKQVVNDALRRGLSPGGPAIRDKPYRVAPHRSKLRPGLDPGALNRLADEIEDEVLLAKRRRSTPKG